MLRFCYMILSVMSISIVQFKRFYIQFFIFFSFVCILMRISHVYSEKKTKEEERKKIHVTGYFPISSFEKMNNLVFNQQ